MTPAILRTKEAAKFVGVSESTLWRIQQTDPSFPRKIVLTKRCVGWKPEDLLQWLELRGLSA